MQPLIVSPQKKCLFAPTTQRRGRHNVPALTHGQKFVNDGVGGMMSPDGYDIAWTQYQGYTVQRLNELTVGTVAPSLNDTLSGTKGS